MKVAIITDTFLPQTNGVVTAICNQATELVKKGIEVVIIAPGERTKLEYYNGAKVYYIRSRKTKIYSGYRVVWPDQMYNTLLTILEIEEPDVYHLQTPMTLGVSGLWYARKFKKPVFATYNTHIESYAAHLTRGNFKFIVEKTLGKSTWSYLYFFYNLCNKTFVPGKEMEKELIKKGIKNTVVLSNCIDKRKFQVKKFFDIRRKYKIPKKAKIVLHVGRISFEKRIDVLLKAFKKIEREQDDVYLIIVGSGPWLEKLRGLSNSIGLKRAILAGYVEDKYLPSFYKQCDVFASASDTETQGIVFAEAMLFGKPLVGCDKLGAKDMIADGKNGYIFKCGDYTDMADRILAILRDEKTKKKMGKFSKKMSREFTEEKFIKTLLKFYKKYDKSVDTSFDRFFNRLDRFMKMLQQNL